MIKTTGDIFGRVATAMITPFDDDLNIDFKAVEKLVRHLIDTGSSSIVVSGTTGESPTLDDAEKKDLLKAVIDAADGKVKIIMGTGSNDTRKSVKLSVEAEKLGAKGLLLVAPYYNKPSQEGMQAHYSEIAKSTSLPIILYNIPGRTGVNLNAESTIALAQAHANIVALKDSTGSLEQAQEVASMAPSHFRIYSGDDNMTLPFLSVGACGVISVASHVIGSEIKRLIDSFYEGKIDDARTLHYLHLPLFKGLFIAPNPTCVKYAMARMGFCKENLRLPLVPLNSAQKAIIDQLLQELKPLEATASSQK